MILPVAETPCFTPHLGGGTVSGKAARRSGNAFAVMSPVYTDYLYFSSARNGMPPRCGVDEVASIQDVLTSVSAGQGTGAALQSFSRLDRWPGISFVPVIDAPCEQSALASRRDDTRPQVQAFRALAARLARELGPRLTSASELIRSDV